MTDKTVLVNFRVPVAQKQRLEDEAKRAGMSLSAYLRDLALSERTYNPPTPPQASASPDTRRFAQTAPVTTKTDIETDTITLASRTTFKGPDLKDKWKSDYKRAG